LLDDTDLTVFSVRLTKKRTNLHFVALSDLSFGSCRKTCERKYMKYTFDACTENKLKQISLKGLRRPKRERITINRISDWITDDASVTTERTKNKSTQFAVWHS